ncbi:MAG: hypothetical protein AUJ72_00740 [Candidatus Omnitrophica bacterium CG1_02_46_14]|nr:MAG: hypothetical protein AUJ72_00740 [Candidatus Omnitrophica bacterium CG1_02_46_14]
MTAEIFVLNYNGKDLMAECLPSILAAVKASPVSCSLTVIDNQSRDGSIRLLEEHFKEVRVYLAKKNLVFCSYNDAVRESKADVAILLNNDIKTEKDFIAPLLKVFQDHPDAFLAAPKATTFDGSRYEGSLSKMFFRYGQFGAESRFDGFQGKVDRPGYTMAAGFGAFKRATFLELGGFDHLYLPGTVEDSDICFRAWKRGYACYYVPESCVFHKGQATFKKTFGRSRLLAMNQRNLYLFIWKNISDPGLLAEHLAWLLLRPLFFLLRGRFEFLWGFLWALPRLPRALKRRFSGFAGKVRSDRAIFKISESL